MGERVSVHAKVNEDVWESFLSYVIEVHGQKYGNVGREVENALNEYMDNDRAARIEDKVDTILTRLPDADETHTHTPNSSIEKARRIAESLRDMDATIFGEEDLVRAIEDGAGVADDRSIEKYKDILRRRGHAYEHPTDDMTWTTSRDEWIRWCVDYVNNTPSVTRIDVIEGYPITGDELEKEAISLDVEA